MDIGVIFAGLAVLLIAGAIWNFAPAEVPRFVVYLLAGLLVLLGLYLVIVGVVPAEVAD